MILIIKRQRSIDELPVQMLQIGQNSVDLSQDFCVKPDGRRELLPGIAGGGDIGVIRARARSRGFPFSFDDLELFVLLADRIVGAVGVTQRFHASLN